ncbi:uncharacterized protein LOC117649361 [Thrips palmi]|uniref:Uncharacterized protein LOC117649361 n=1 Tax=Thrips palmi TaxID=161013 RepID=A0A6P8ZRW3_THRPL|nr:uncharacterized protein LOC117649361 [Thrips palmi]XP_034247937.1 uncharacterized protein LOC117649361 [Thrips palmi]
MDSMESWGKIWNLHRDRPEVHQKVQAACATIVRNRHHGDVNHKKLMEANLIVLEYCGDFNCQSHLLKMIISDERVQLYNDWFAAAWFMGRPKTFYAFMNLLASEISVSDFLNIYNDELEFQFLYSAQCVLVRWQDESQAHAGHVGLHLNCGTKTISLSGLQAVPTEFSAEGLFVLRSTEIKKVQVLNVDDPHGFGKLQGIRIETTKGQLFVHTDPHIVDWTMFCNFVNFISKVTVEFERYPKEGSNVTDLNGNELQSKRTSHDFGQSFNFCANEDAVLLQPVVQNSVFQVSSSQDALKTLAINSDSNDIEICHHYKRVSNESCNDSDTADESHDQISVPVNKFLKNECEGEKKAEVNCSLEDTDNGKESHQHDNSNVANSQEDNNLLQLLAAKPKMPHYADLDAGNTPNTEEDTSSQLVAVEDNDAHVATMVYPKTKSKRGRRKTLNTTGKPRLASPVSSKVRGEAQEESDKSDSELMGTPRRITRRYTQHIKDAMGGDADSEFKTPIEPPKSFSRKRAPNRKRKSDDDTSFTTEVETSPTSAILPSQPGAEDTTDTSPFKSARPSSGDESGTFSAVDEIMESTLPPKVPDSMPTLETPIATPVRDPEDSLIQSDFNNIHEKLNEELKSDALKEETTYMPDPLPIFPSNMPPTAAPAIPAYLLQGPPTAIPLHANPPLRSSGFRNYNMCLPPKQRRYDDDDDLKSENGDIWEMNAMDSSSDTSYLENAGSAVLLPADDNGFSSTPDALKTTAPIGEMNNLQQFSEICSNVENTDEHQ